MISDISASTAAQDIAALMSDPALAHLHMGGAPVILASSSPVRVIYASAAACNLLGTRDHALLAARLFGGQDAASQRLQQLATRISPAPPRLERLRLFIGGGAETLTAQCSSVRAPSGAVLFVLAAPGVRPALLRHPAPELPLAEAAAAAGVPVAALGADVAAASHVPRPLPDAAPSGESPVCPAAGDARVVMEEATLPPADPEAGFMEPAARAPIVPSAPASVPEPGLAGNTGRPVRFSWRSDGHHKLTDVTDPLLRATGLPREALVGHIWNDIIDRLDLDAQGHLVSTLSRHSTWSGLETFWPLAGGGKTLSVTLGGTPLFGADRHFHGYRGFGLIDFDRMPLAQPPGPSPQELPAKAAPPGAEALAGPEAPEPVEIAQEEPAAADVLHSPAGLAVPANDQHGPAAAPSAAHPAAPVPHEPLVSLVASTDQPSHPPDPKIVRLRPPQVHLKLAPPASSGEADKPDAASADPASGEGGAGLPVTASSLSSSERQAFSEIARSLTAKIKDAAPENLAPAPMKPAPHNRVAEPALPVAEMPAVTAPVLPAWQDANAAQIFQRLPLGVLVSRNAEPLFINPSLLDILGYADPAAFVAAKGFARMFRGHQPELLDAAPEGGSLPVIGADGEVILAEGRLQTIEWDGQPASLLTLRRAAETDHGARLRTLEMELRQHEGQLRELHSILDTATDGVAILDDNGQILSLNRSAEALFGYEQNEVAGEPFTMLVAKGQQQAAMDYLEGIKTNGVASVLNDGREFLGRARQGGAIPLFMTLGRVGPGVNPKFCAILRDLTQWKKVEGELGDARREAERASQLKSDFLAKISHEIRTPLNAILGFAEVMSEERFGPIGNERYKEYLKDIHTSGSHVMSLVNDLLDLSKIEAGKMELEFSSVDANKIVAECVSMMQPQAASERVVVRQSLAPRLPNIVADERALRQIVLNLLSNAVKFNEAGGQVIVSTALTDAGHAVIRIRDTGIGMTDTDVAAAMEPFKQLATSRKKSGTGLGLPLTKALVEANRASFSIKSKKNEGTLVEVAFPPTRVLAE